MSLRGLMKHRCTVKSLDEVVVDGASTYDWVVKQTNLRCFIDLAKLAGRDPYFTPEGGRPSERAGMLVVMPNEDGSCPVRSGDVVQITRGPSGSFKVENIIDEIWTPDRLHHYELGVTEVAPQIARKQVSR